MCGIFGMLGRGIILRDLEAFEELGIVSQLRGRDGAGIYKVNSVSAAYPQDLLIKSGSDFCNLLYDIETRPVRDPVSRMLESIMSNVFIGHVRAKTKGKVSDDNAHPFELPNLVGAHNGTLKDKQYEDWEKTDSELMFTDMSDRGIMPVLQGLEDNSAFAVVIYNKVDRQMYFARNEYRPLHFARIEGRNVLYWASERAMLELVINRNRDKAKYFSIRDNYLFSINPNEYTHTDEKVFHVNGVISEKKLEERKRLEEEWKAKQEAALKEVSNENSTNVPFNPPFTSTSAQVHQPATTPKVVSFPSRTSTYSYDNLVNGVQPICSKQRDSYANTTFRGHCVKCECGKKVLNVYDSWAVRKGLRVFPNYNSNTDSFVCEDACSQEVKKVTLQ